ncbi:hypothetical protein [Promineifilum sp.]|uniref:hypothetical protein n=1 Tax=Promineifilum sp. TaxID=2664178 RepID=UPI0035B37CC9
MTQLTVAIEEKQIRDLLKEVLLELIETRRDMFQEIVLEALEDVGLMEAIKEGERSGTANRDEIMAILEGLD